MKIDNLKELRALVKEMRKSGIDAIKIDGIEFTLQDTQPKAKKQAITSTYTPGIITADTRIITEELTPEQMLFYSADSGIEQQ